jgi:anti-sigma28 factor (negative regulator of flagellin synthesis)
MKINSVSNGLPYQPDQKPVVKKEQAEPEKKDSPKISAEAKNLQTESLKAKNAEVIKEKIASGFYNSDKVLSEIVDKILKELYS